MFVKNSTERWQTEPLHRLNFFERKFYWNSFKNAVVHIAGKWQFEHLSKYTKNAINTARDAVDAEQFNPNIKPIGRKKTKFTFFSPLRLDKS